MHRAVKEPRRRATDSPDRATARPGRKLSIDCLLKLGWDTHPLAIRSPPATMIELEAMVRIHVRLLIGDAPEVRTR